MRTLIVVGLLALPAVAAVAGGEPADTKKLDAKTLNFVTLPKERGPAAKALMEWLDAREVECKLTGDVVLVHRNGLAINVMPLGLKDGCDRLRVFTVFAGRDEFRAAPEFEQHAMRLNRVQNLFQVYVENGNLVVAGNITYCDELSARLFDRYLSLYVAALRQHVLTPATLKMIK